MPMVNWFAVVFPALVLNYLGQGGLLLSDPRAIENPFYLLAPGMGSLPDGGVRDGGHRHRLAVDHLRRVTNQSSITGPKILPMNAVPLR